MPDTIAPELELKQAIATLKQVTDETKRFAETAQAEMKNLGKTTDETKVNADKSLTQLNEVTARLTDIEQKMARHGGGGNPPVDERKSLGQHVVENEDMKSRLLGGDKKGRVNMVLETKNIISATGTWGVNTSVSNSLVVADRVAPVNLPMRPMTIRSLIAPGQTVSNAIEFAVQTRRINNASVVPETQQKPFSDYGWELKSFPVRTIAHLVKASRQILDDAPALQSTIDAEMRYGLDFTEEQELLYGDGTGAHLLGLIPQSTPFVSPFAIADETGIDRIRLAMLQGVLALYPMTGIVLNPIDWTKIEMLKDSSGKYLIGDPQGTLTPRLWSLPVVSSLALAPGMFLTGAFAYAAQIFDRMAVEVLVSTENVNDFETNMITIRAEERLALVVKRPQALISGPMQAP